MLLRGTFEPCLGGVGSWKQRKTLVLILNMEEFEGEESDFVSKCLSRKFTLHRMMLISKKNSAATKTKRWLLNSSTFVDHTKSHPMKMNVPFRDIWIQFSWTNPQKFTFTEDCPKVRGGGVGEMLELLTDWLPGHFQLSSLQRDFLWCNDQETYCSYMRHYLLFGF